MSNPYGFISACDTPFLMREMIETVIHKIEAQIDIVMPETSAGFEPLCAAYSKRCLEAAQNHLEREKLKITKTFRKSRIKTISEKSLRKIDPELRSFFNINTPQDLARAEEMVNG